MFEGKVALITGAGGGLGRCYALLLSSLGCKVVVNDLGTKQRGNSLYSPFADAVVSEISAQGGTAVAEYSSVTGDAQKIIDFCISTFGALHILINNAGLV